MKPEPDLAALNPPERLAVAYAPRAAQPLWQGFLALGHRLADAAREGREPLMIQLRLAWWRDRFDQPVSEWPASEPLLALLEPWDAERAALRGLVDGWEALVVGEDGGAALDAARVNTVLALARLCGVSDHEPVRRAAAEWLGLQPPAPPAPRLPKALRPLAILRGLALRGTKEGAASPLSDYLTLLRIGTFGR